MCVLHLDDTIECFYIKSIPAVDQRKIMVTMDLELFYENFDNLTEEIAQVKTGISKVLDKNHENHSKTLQKMLDKKVDVYLNAEEAVKHGIADIIV